MGISIKVNFGVKYENFLKGSVLKNKTSIQLFLAFYIKIGFVKAIIDG